MLINVKGKSGQLSDNLFSDKTFNYIILKTLKKGYDLHSL